MAGEIVYAELDIGPGKHCRKLHSLPQPGSKCIVGIGSFIFGGEGCGCVGRLPPSGWCREGKAPMAVVV